MKRRWWIFGVVGVGLGGAVAATACVSVRAPGPPTTASAPPFALRSHRDATVRLDELTGRGPAVLVFYRGHW
ncbi:MAG: hypothetical protein AAF928_09040 [Myxococcota bacterium]